MAKLEKPDAGNKLWLFIALYVITTLNFTATSLFSPLINRQLRVLEISPFILGIVGSIYGTFQLVSSPFVGFGSHKYGVELMFILAILGTAVNNFAQVGTSSLIVFVLARSLAGFLKHTCVLEKLLLTQLAKRNEIAWGLGYLGAFSNLGVIIGPSLGVLFLQQEDGLKLVFTMAVGIYSLIFILMGKLLFSSKTIKSNETQSVDNLADFKQRSRNTWRTISIKSILNEGQLLFVLFLKFCFVFGSHLIRSNFPIILQRKHTATESSIGYLNSIQSTTATLIGFLVSPIIFYIYKNNQRKMIIHAGSVQMISFICLVISPTLICTSVSILLLEMANPFLWVSIVALSLDCSNYHQSNQRASIKNTGTIISLGVMISNISQMTAPLCAGLVVLPQIGFIGNDGPAMLAAVFSFLGILTTFLFIPRQPSHKNTCHVLDKLGSASADGIDEKKQIANGQILFQKSKAKQG